MAGKKCRLILTFIISFSFQCLCEKNNIFEIEGLFNFNTFSENVYLNINEEIGINPFKKLNVSIGGEQSYRNYSLASIFFLSVNYRFIKSKITLPAGGLMGFRSMRIGDYKLTIPLTGLETGVFYNLTDNISIRLKYRFIIFFDEINIYSNSLLIGLGFSFYERKKDI